MTSSGAVLVTIDGVRLATAENLKEAAPPPKGYFWILVGGFLRLVRGVEPKPKPEIKPEVKP